MSGGRRFFASGAGVGVLPATGFPSRGGVGCRVAVPLRQRKVDLAFVICFALFALASLFSDALHGLGVLDGDNVFARAHVTYIEITGDRVFASGDPHYRLATLISGFIYGPFYLVLIYAFVRAKAWIQLPAMLYIGSIVRSMVVALHHEFVIGPPPEHALAFLAFNLPWLIVPVLLGVRLWRADPFGPR